MCANRRMVIAVAALMGWFAMAGVGLADFIGVSDGNTVTATAGSQLDGVVAPSNLVDGSGMTPNGPVVMASTTDNANGGQGMWLSGADPADKSVLFTFANNTSLSEMVVWNYNQNWESGLPGSNFWERGLKDVTITYSTGADASGTGNVLYSGELACATGAAAQAYTSDLLVPGGPVADVKAVKIAYTSAWNGGAYCGLSEVRFVAVPEPSALLMAIAGILGLMAYAWRKRR